MDRFFDSPGPIVYACAVTFDDKEIQFRAREFTLLDYLANRQCSQVVTRDDIEQHL
jgi:DNA-binding response OmpR family regulator